MKKQIAIWFFGVGFLLLTLCSCGRSNDKVPAMTAQLNEDVGEALKSGRIEEVMDAKQALMQMFKENRLPGVSPSDHGNASSGDIAMMTSNKVLHVTYPLSVKFDLDKAGEKSTNHYQLLRTTRGSEWQLQRAWRTDEQGRPAEEWKVK